MNQYQLQQERNRRRKKAFDPKTRFGWDGNGDHFGGDDFLPRQTTCTLF